MKKERFIAYLRGEISEEEIRAELRAEGEAANAGGLTVPFEMAREIMAIASLKAMRRLATVYTIGAAKLEAPVESLAPAVDWTPEGGSFPITNPEFSGAMLTVKKIGGIARVSDELVEDSAFEFDNLITETFGDAVGQKEDAAFISGDGESEPAGFLHDAESTDATGAAITYADLKALYKALPLEFHNRAAWLANANTLAEIMELADANGTPAFRASSGADGEAGYIMGRPVYLAGLPEIGAGTKPLAFGDFSKYVIADRENSATMRRVSQFTFEQEIPDPENEGETLTVKTSYANHGQTGFLYYHRTDGKLLKPEAVRALTMPAG